ncbi:hypothetical protein AHAS_Ahas03G0223800 [Arachis hypogaea]
MLLNCQAVKDYVKEYITRSSKERRPNPTNIEKRIFKDFVSWFEKRVSYLIIKVYEMGMVLRYKRFKPHNLSLFQILNPNTIEQLSTDIKFLARGPLSNATRYSAYKNNGFTFQTNSGVYLTSSTPCVASQVDRNLRQGDVPYCGKLEDIIEVSYYRQFIVVLFKCKWADST